MVPLHCPMSTTASEDSRDREARHRLGEIVLPQATEAPPLSVPNPTPRAASLHAPLQRLRRTTRRWSDAEHARYVARSGERVACCAAAGPRFRWVAAVVMLCMLVDDTCGWWTRRVEYSAPSEHGKPWMARRERRHAGGYGPWKEVRGTTLSKH